jgi:tRNA (mo5U34)-methyltransferase
MTVAVADISAEVEARRPWYHAIELPGGIVTPGVAPSSPSCYRLAEDLSGLRVLDVGAWDGYWSFEAVRRGAEEVLAIDDHSDPGDTWEPVKNPLPHPGWSHFEWCRELLGIDPKRCRCRTANLYELDPAEVGQFDLVLFFGVLYHCRYPLLALERLHGLTRRGGELLLESATLDGYSPYRGGVQRGYPGHQMVMEFYPDAQYSGISTNWWVPTLQCLAYMTSSAGFDVTEVWARTTEPTELHECRGHLRGKRSG